MSSSSLFRRLHGIFNHSRSPTRIFNKPNLSLPSSATKKSNKSPAATPLTAEQGLQELANKFIKNSESKLFRRKKGTYDYTIRLLAVRKSFSMIEDIIEAQKKYEDIKDEGFATRLIMLYGKAGMLSHARKLFDELPALNCERTVRSFNALLSSCVNSKEFDQVEKIFREVPRELSIEADVRSYNIVINAYCEMDALDKAILFFNDMEKNGMEPDLVTFNTLLAALYRKGQFSDGESIWAMMESKNIAPNLISYNARLRGMVLEKRIQDGIELLAEMEEKEIKPDVYSYNILIKGFCEDGDLEEAKKWYDKLKESEVVPNASTYATLLSLLCEQGDFDFGLQLCKEAIDNGLVFHTAEVQRVVDGLAEDSKMEEANDLVELYNSNSKLKFKLKLPQNST
ncbi:pentatricopeptide repeat-containing protein [Cucumis melo var. makuwa]|uniref:Pentatricopeptide repeat-containing protein At1g55890, mitochondrial-like n=2 Tax=Cucumis melo TaxID=3656 RepID=A0A1S3AZY0_CUCME|nr:pentatricopeptide repeat-containing protein At1g55890, mitochondrial-like [Cucumis melo]KAA0052739.1 pentatricopeptide repeat-containing protein [Cucumis melo var. makuwa]